MEKSLKRLHELTELLDSRGPDGHRLPEEVSAWISTRKQTIVIRRVPNERVAAQRLE